MFLDTMKFNALQGNKDTHNYATITIKDNPPKVLKLPKKTFLNAKDLKEIINFVINNREILLMLSDKVIDISDFKEQMIPGGNLIANLTN